MNAKKILIACCLLFSVEKLFADSAVVNKTTVKLRQIINNSYEDVMFKGVAKNFTIKHAIIKNLFVAIPFTSTQENLSEFIQDRPYLPTYTLKIITQQGTFHIWREERGVVVAKAFELGMSRKEAVPQVFLKLSQQDLTRVIACIVTVDATGLISLKKA